MIRLSDGDRIWERDGGNIVASRTSVCVLMDLKRFRDMWRNQERLVVIENEVRNEMVAKYPTLE